MFSLINIGVKLKITSDGCETGGAEKDDKNSDPENSGPLSLLSWNLVSHIHFVAYGGQDETEFIILIRYTVFLQWKCSQLLTHPRPICTLSMQRLVKGAFAISGEWRWSFVLRHPKTRCYSSRQRRRKERHLQTADRFR